MAIQDLKYPEDAIKVIDSLATAMRYVASVAVLGVRVRELPEAEGGPVGDVRFRASGKHEDMAVQREAPLLLSRFALLQALSHFEHHACLLLLQRRVLEHLAPDKRMQPGELWNILKNVHQESKPGPVRVAFEKVVTAPSRNLAEMRPWLEGLYAVRNCLAHRNGQVEIVDVAPDQRRLELTTDADRLRATWLNVTITSGGEPVELPFQHKGDDLGVALNPYSREWRVGEKIDVTPSEIQGICLAVTLLGKELLRCFLTEMDEVLGVSAQS